MNASIGECPEKLHWFPLAKKALKVALNILSSSFCEALLRYLSFPQQQQRP